MRLLVPFLILALALPAAAQEAATNRHLPPTVARALKAAAIPEQAVAVVVQEVGSIFPRVDLNASRAMNPASVMKLVTTFAALDLLGPAYTWKTEALAGAAPADGVLAGDLILRGSGDPSLTFEQFWLLLRQLRGRGLREIRGDLVLDRSAFAVPPHDEAAFDGKPQRPYNAGPDALLLNFKAVRLTLLPAADGIRVLPEPAPANLDIVNLVKPNGGNCGDWRDNLRADLVRHEGSHNGSFRLILTGSYAAACGEQRWNLNLLPQSDYLLGVFRQLWAELGGSFGGTVREAATPADARPLASIDSPPLAEVVRNINKFSNNVMARQLFLTLGQKVGAGGTAANAESVVRRWLEERGLRFPELVLDNGSGLSRHERISAESTARLLAAAWSSAVMPELMSSLPLLAVDGTLKKRQGSAAGQAHIKTGSLEGVKTLAGYVLDRRGRRQIVVFFVNHPNAAAAQPAQDALLQWVYERGA
ncbi:MAG: D-alanyl-D-alanine carboxypeptidase/D-alanyl-D-alanine-endopeptidase [Gammaproteobacteria bacterium]|nr:D-alanyl-D-alanine carboxypeptidase/D-alanyl-D-alanine-endopeptidase [Gammaproteobacteria bacterium]MBU1646899.1 D-alanyl-D-alanine carboxypeptidase/D-alanyl-D-alanine-endopeptidase [Gammaproteobacteria bacterium]MBU1971160.1 D-alanyl-D-alanine carboxypeptidase/D-alanyl-D-alanine-endopeptidase [Gammaproteobacteria bacterium]